MSCAKCSGVAYLANLFDLAFLGFDHDAVIQLAHFCNDHRPKPDIEDSQRRYLHHRWRIRKSSTLRGHSSESYKCAFPRNTRLGSVQQNITYPQCKMFGVDPFHPCIVWKANTSELIDRQAAHISRESTSACKVLIGDEKTRSRSARRENKLHPRREPRCTLTPCRQTKNSPGHALKRPPSSIPPLLQ